VHTGASVEPAENGAVVVVAGGIANPEAPYEVVKTMRARAGARPCCSTAGRVSPPGGCAIGARPINLHITGLEQLAFASARTRLHRGRGPERTARRPDSVRPKHRHGDGGLLMAATLAEGGPCSRTPRGSRRPTLPACSPRWGRDRGRHIHHSRHGVPRLHGAEHTIIADRIEAGPF
jgi:UDP-N-acetylglucosamine 1-carboxyvinyltransferase